MKKILNKNTINPLLIEMQYAVRGLVPIIAGEIEKEIKVNGEKYPFKEILYCNIGNPQSVGQKPITWFRDVISLVDAPHLLEKPEIANIFPSDTISRAKKILEQVPNGTGAYSHSLGIEGLRKQVAEFITQRDGYEADPSHVILTNGASSGIELVLTALIADPSVGVLIPIPQYPIYSALIKILNGTQLTYNLIESKNWAPDVDEIRRTLKEARAKGVNPRVMVIINPGNPTGSVLSREELTQLVKLCKEEGLIILADEVYQKNIYSEKEFTSVKKVVRSLGKEYDEMEFISFHSTSKGLIGECGRRGGYMEICGISDDMFAQVCKLQSSKLCSNLDGQVMTSLMVNPPVKGDVSYDNYVAEEQGIYNSLKRKSQMLYQKLNSIDGISCRPLEGAMYAFPRIELPQTAIDVAEAAGQSPDTFYALSLLRETGICSVPGSGFGQEAGTFHIRITFLPEEEKLKKALEAFEKHHLSFLKKYGNSNI